MSCLIPRRVHLRSVPFHEHMECDSFHQFHLLLTGFREHSPVFVLSVYQGRNLSIFKVYIYKKQQIPTNLKIYWRSATCIISCIIVFDKETRLLKKRVGDWYASIRSYLLRFLERVQGWPYRNKNLHRHRKGWRETLDACLATAQQPKRKKLYKCLCTKKRCFKRQLS